MSHISFGCHTLKVTLPFIFLQNVQMFSDISYIVRCCDFNNFSGRKKSDKSDYFNLYINIFFCFLSLSVRTIDIYIKTENFMPNLNSLKTLHKKKFCRKELETKNFRTHLINDEKNVKIPSLLC
jgi:hypothetical protein